ncbi:uncharacterized protein LOC112203741 [Rosa chinensis]|uniref:uncharacterized protein LOC112203741 n=1 Tax=Rosa chinensis TaxID=74649 RepID=UPI000D092120|nr:uncharacterized protein LOC112203741 [Rosa chinensis]
MDGEAVRGSNEEEGGIGVGDFEDNEGMYGAVDSDEEGIGHDYNSDDEGEGDRFPEFNPKVDMRDPHFCKGMKFASPKILRAAIRERAIQDGWEPLFLKNDRVRLRAICKAEDFPFESFASKMQHEDTLMIKTYHGEHNCARVYENSTVKTPYLTDKFADQIKLNPNISIEALAQTMAAGVRARVSFQQAYRTKKAALKRERRMYVCLGALKRGFRAGCRPIFGFDGCHLKSAFGSQLLATVGLDPNNTTYVVAYAMVEMESKDSWDWFLGILVNDLDIRGEGNGYTIISDKQKGLLPASEAVLPLAEHRFCVRHLWTNFNKLFPGKS